MLFRVKNLGLIDEAEIKLDGITVLTGENNVGKSTIGRMLYCVNNALMYDGVEEIRIYRLERTIENYLREHSILPLRKIKDLLYDTAIAKKIIAEHDNLNKEDPSQGVLRYTFSIFFLEDEDFDVEFLENKILEILKLSDQDISSELLDIAIGTNFSGTTHNIYGENDLTRIELRLGDSERYVRITVAEDVSIDNSKNIAFGEAIYIESPRVVHDTDKKLTESSFFLNFDSRQRLVQLLTDDSEADYWEKKEIDLEIKNILDKISTLAPGKLVRESSLTRRLVYEEGNHRFDLINVSSGVKTFAILKKLLTDCKLKRRGILILDEPEIHLHPDWQLVFAEILVLLQKQFNLKILINTHSTYFLMAIEEYSTGYKIDDKCNYYLIKREGNHSTCKDCTDNLNKIYQHLANSLDTLDNLRWEDDQ